MFGVRPSRMQGNREGGCGHSLCSAATSHIPAILPPICVHLCGFTSELLRDFLIVLMASSMRSGTPLQSQAQEIVYNVVKYLKHQKELHNVNYKIVKATHDAPSVSDS